MAFFPGSVATDANLYLVSNNLAAALTSAIDNTVTTIPVVSTAGFPTTGWITIDQEAIQYTGITGTDFTGCTRGAGGTVAASHLIGAGVKQTVVAAHHNVLKDEIKAIEQYLSDHLGLATVVTAAEFERLVGVTSPIQTQLNGKEPTITVLPISKGGTNSGAALNNQRIIKSESGAIVEAPAITANRALASDANGIPVHTAVTDTELGRVSGVTSPIQTQLDSMLPKDGSEAMAGNLPMGANKITGLGDGTAAQDAAAYKQVKILQVVSASSTTVFTTTSSSFVDTNLTASITPSSTSSTIIIIISGTGSAVAPATIAYFTLKRGSTNLGDASVGFQGISFPNYPVNTNIILPVAFNYKDSPASTSPQTYSVQIRSTSGANNVSFGVASSIQSIILMEVSGL